MDFDKLRPGDLIKTTFGARGSQKAVVEKVSGRGTIYAKKWSASSGRFTKPIRLYPGDYLGYIGRWSGVTPL